jgi:hypothetical protein
LNEFHESFGGITEGNPPLLAFSEIVARPDGKRKLISQIVQVTDAALLSRLRREVHNGDKAEIIVEQHISSSVLKDFTAPSD